MCIFNKGERRKVNQKDTGALGDALCPFCVQVSSGWRPRWWGPLACSPPSIRKTEGRRARSRRRRRRRARTQRRASRIMGGARCARPPRTARAGPSRGKRRPSLSRPVRCSCWTQSVVHGRVTDLHATLYKLGVTYDPLPALLNYFHHAAL